MRGSILALSVGVLALFVAPCARAQDLSSEEVLRSIEAGSDYLIGQQNADGSWSNTFGRIGPSSLAVMALINSGMPTDAAPVRKGLEFLRKVNLDDFDDSKETYETSLLIMALASAKDVGRDRARIMALTQRLEAGQNNGMWTYSLRAGGLLAQFGGGDRSNSQFAVLGLREAAFSGVPVNRATWIAIAEHWLTSQNADGGWAYSGGPGQGSYGSMTVAGIATLNIVKTLLRDDDLKKDGTINCCGRNKDEDLIDQALERAYRWMETHFAVTHNPGSGSWLLYYVYGLERAGRLSGRRFFGDHDWYREGADFLVRNQTPRDGGWRGSGGGDSDPILATSFSLLFLSKGLSPVLINKLKFGPTREDGAIVGDAWNQHPNDVRNLTELVSTLPKWPKLVTWQVADLPKIVRNGSVGDLLQAPVLYISGREGAPALSDVEAAMLRSYIEQGGFIFAAAGCDRPAFEQGMRDLVAKVYPNGEGELTRLGADHPIYRAEYLLDPDAVELWGVDVGCRTAIVYSPDDLGCLWERWLPYDPIGRSPKLVGMITQKMRIGVNVVAYATGREPPSKLDVDTDPSDDGQQDAVERGLLQVAKLRHSGNWDAAPRALHNLLMGLNEKVGLAASTKKNSLVATDPDLYKYPVVYMHGRTAFTLGPKEIERLREHLDRGAVLFADSCCGSAAFDASFRTLVKSLHPDAEFKRIPPDHELFTTAIGADLSQVRRRVPGAGDGPLDADVQVGPPLLEGVEIDGRYPIVYSKYDISCALEKQSSAACAGYVPQDALKIAINVIMYAMLQDVGYSGSF